MLTKEEKIYYNTLSETAFKQFDEIDELKIIIDRMSQALLYATSQGLTPDTNSAIKAILAGEVTIKEHKKPMLTVVKS